MSWLLYNEFQTEETLYVNYYVNINQAVLQNDYTFCT
jgi:hypothetical protein